jgi:hypothetical protein
MPRILVDLSHNERYSHIPSGIFGVNYTFEFLYPGMQLPELRILRDYNLIIIGEIIPAQNGRDHLFLNVEIELLKNYVKQGGKLLVTTSSGGDNDYKGQDEDVDDYRSIRALSPMTGIKRYWWGELFHPKKSHYYQVPENLLISHFPSHPIFEDIHKVMFADTTFLEPSTIHVPQVILTSQPGTMFRYYIDDSEEKMDNVPIMTSRLLGKGECVVIGSTLFMSKQPIYGISVADNLKLFKNIIKYLVKG